MEDKITGSGLTPIKEFIQGEHQPNAASGIRYADFESF